VIFSARTLLATAVVVSAALVAVSATHQHLSERRDRRRSRRRASWSIGWSTSEVGGCTSSGRAARTRW
jgi:hypothetical protein